MEVFRTLGAAIEPPGPWTDALARALGIDAPIPDESAYTDVFLFQLYPYASVYLGPEGMIGGEAQDRVAGFWRALGMAPPPEPDHLAALLGLYASLCRPGGAPPEAARRRLREEAAAALLWEHVLPWLPPYLDRVEDVAPAFYAAWAGIARAALLAAAGERGTPGALPVHLRAAAAVPDPRTDGAEAFLAGLLSPCRSGVILTRADLARCARDLGLGLRAGERRYALRALLGQDAGGTLGWLAAEARRQADRHRAWPPALGPVRRVWSGRADAAAALLAALGPAIDEGTIDEGRDDPHAAVSIS